MTQRGTEVSDDVLSSETFQTENKNTRKSGNSDAEGWSETVGTGFSVTVFQTDGLFRLLKILILVINIPSFYPIQTLINMQKPRILIVIKSTPYTH